MSAYTARCDPTPAPSTSNSMLTTCSGAPGVSRTNHRSSWSPSGSLAAGVQRATTWPVPSLSPAGQRSAVFTSARVPSAAGNTCTGTSRLASSLTSKI